MAVRAVGGSVPCASRLLAEYADILFHFHTHNTAILFVYVDLCRFVYVDLCLVDIVDLCQLCRMLIAFRSREKSSLVNTTARPQS